MKATCLSCAVLLLATGTAGAETLYNKDGVQLSATARVIDAGGATCRIREERHSAEEYARLQPNHGQPLDVWRVELVVANYSGKALDYLSAHLNVESAWPPCDNWDGLGNYGKQVVWTGPLMTIHVVSSVEPGEERREIAFVLAWHEDDPVLGRWNIDYDFEAGAPAAPADAGAGRPAPTGTEAQGERTAGRQSAPEPTCAVMDVGSSCWMEIENNPGCYTWNSYLSSNETVTWSGECAGSLAQGTGSRTSSYTDGDGNPASKSETGDLLGGKEHGHWTARYADGTVGEGPYVDGKQHGHWTLRYPTGEGLKGGVYEGLYVEGKRNGRWTWRWADGTVEEGPYVDGKRNGHWTWRWADGTVEEGPYVDGKRNGHWTWRWASGAVGEGPYVDGERHGHWTARYAGGRVEEGPYVDGKRHGHWVVRSGDGNYREEGPYVDGKKHGHFVERSFDGSVAEGPYVDDKKHGYWTTRFDHGRVEEGPYVDGERHGHWTTRTADGSVMEGPFVDGHMAGRWTRRWPSGTVEHECYANGYEVDC